MKDAIGRVAPVDAVGGSAVGSGPTADAGSFDALVRDAAVPPFGDESSVNGPVGAVAAHLDASRTEFERGLKTLRRQADAVSLAKVAVLQTHYSNAAQLAIRGIQKGAQAVNDLTKLQ